MRYLFIIASLLLFGCCQNCQSIRPSEKVAFARPDRHSVKGDFDGDGRQDILREYLVDSTGNRVDTIPKQDTWEETVEYYGTHGYSTIVVMDGRPADTLAFDYAQGLYCLINVGDLNNDSRDEIALIPDNMDFSRHSYCHIYSFCPSGWKGLFKFSVHEGVFDYTGDRPPVFTNIPGALEHRNKEWYFYDYLDMDYQSIEEVGRMKKLVVPSCN